MLHKAIACAGAVLSALSVAGCGQPEQQAVGQRQTIRAVVVPFLFTAPFHIAHEEGYFDDEDIDVEFVRLERNLDAIPALAQGQVDVGAGQVTVTALNAIAGGTGIRVVAGVGHLADDTCTFNGIVVRRGLIRDGVPTNPEALRGRSARIDELLPQAYWLNRALRPAGLTIDDLEAIKVPPPAMVQGFVQGAYDILVPAEPYLTRVLAAAEDAELWLGTERTDPDYQQNVVFFGRTLLQEKPELGRRFMKALQRGMRQYNRGKTRRNLDILQAATGLARDELVAMCWVSMHDDGRIHVEGLRGYQEWANERGLIDRVVPDEELFDTRFISAAAESSRER